MIKKFGFPLRGRSTSTYGDICDADREVMAHRRLSSGTSFLTSKRLCVLYRSTQLPTFSHGFGQFSQKQNEDVLNSQHVVRPSAHAQQGDSSTLDLENTISHYTPEPKQAWVRSFETGEKLGIIELSDFLFGARPRLDILHRVVVWPRAKIRAGTAKVKDRGEVRGGGRKPYQQKGTGRARQGSRRAPHFVGGGVVHGPRGPVSYEYTLPKKVRRMGLRTALSVKFSQGDLQIVDSLALSSHKTRDLEPILKIHEWESALLVDGGDVDRNLCLASSNLEAVDVLPSRGLNVYSILLRETLVLTMGAVLMLEERLGQDSCEERSTTDIALAQFKDYS